MTAPLFLTLIGIAALDSLNPSLFLAQFYLLTTQRPVPRILSYITGVVLVNFLGGLLFLGGVWSFLRAWFTGLDTTVLAVAELLLGLGLLGFGMWMRAKPTAAGEAKKPHSLSPFHTFLLGAVVMLNELTTALPYLVAIERIAQAELSTWGALGALLLYNLVFALPLLAFLVLLVVLGKRFTSQLDRINQGISVWMPRVLKYAAIIFGVALTIDAGFKLL